MLIPFPTMHSDLALQKHMYIYKDNRHPNYEYIKCQTFKPYMLSNNTIDHYVLEQADIRRNPFNHITIIDCDKVFFTKSVNYSDKLKTTNREDVCHNTFSKVMDELVKDGFSSISLNENELCSLNQGVTFI